MRGPAAAESGTVIAAASHSAPFAPTSVDRLVDRVQRVAPALSHASDRLLIGVAALLALVDLVVWATDHAVDTGRLSVSISFLVPCLGASAVVAVALRPRRPVLALASLAGAALCLTLTTWAIDSSLPPSFAVLFALAVLTIGVLRREPAGTAILLTSLAAVAVAAEAIRPLVSGAMYLLVLSEGAFVVAAGAGVYLRWSDWRRVAAEEAARSEQRLEIARELHDLVGHYVTGIVVQAQAARHVAEHQPASAVAALERIESAGAEAMVAMRRVVGGLRDAGAPERSWDEVDRVVAQAVAAGEPVRATIDAEARSTAPTLGPSVHRIIAESLTNVRRHAREVTAVDVAVFRRADRLVVTVHDDGRVASPSGPDTFGILGMRERAITLGGSLSAGPAPDGGWLVRAELPVSLPR